MLTADRSSWRVMTASCVTRRGSYYVYKSVKHDYLSQSLQAFVSLAFNLLSILCSDWTGWLVSVCLGRLIIVSNSAEKVGTNEFALAAD